MDTAALKLRAWARVWSPVVPIELIDEAWRTLELPGHAQALQSDLRSTFHIGAPAPPIPLILHHALNVPGDGAREDWMRVLTWLGLEFGELRLPPDHLAVACEALAVAVERNERVLVDELVTRYFGKWCEVAANRLAASGNVLAHLPVAFADDLNDAAQQTERANRP